MSRRKTEIKVIQESRQYILWRRVSTKEQGRSELGLDAQLTIAKMFMGKDPFAVYTDVFSGTKLKQCKGLWTAIDLCKKENFVLVIAKSDRCRNVSEALDILDAIGERNLIFCDLPSTDRFILTVMWAMWERQAIMGRINTKIALAERKKQIQQQGGFVSKAGVWRTRLGNKPGVDTAPATQASVARRAQLVHAWRASSPLYTWFTIQVLKGVDLDTILQESGELFEKNPEEYCTRKGQKLGRATAARWRSEILSPAKI